MPFESAARPQDEAVRHLDAQYTRRDPQQTVLYRVIDQHLPPFLEQAREHGCVPGFVEDAFRDFLCCGVLAHGLCRFRCSACRCERLVALSCKGRGYAERVNMLSNAKREAQGGERSRRQLRIFVEALSDEISAPVGGIRGRHCDAVTEARTLLRSQRGTFVVDAV